MTETTMSGCSIPTELAPLLAARLERLLTEVCLTTAPEIVVDPDRDIPRCVVCHQIGKLGGHHDEHGRVQWIHRSCHRRLHRTPRRAPLTPTQRPRTAPSWA